MQAHILIYSNIIVYIANKIDHIIYFNGYLIFSIKLFIGNYFASDCEMIFFVSGWQWDPLATNIIKAHKKYHFAIRSSPHFLFQFQRHNFRLALRQIFLFDAEFG